MKLFANVIIDISHEKVDRSFQYLVPEHLKASVYPGCKVSIPFGRGNTLRNGYVISLSEKPEIDEERMKPIADICDKSVGVEDRMIAIAAFIRQTYGSTMINALRCVLPVKKVTKQIEYKRIKALKDSEELRVAGFQAASKKRNAQARLLKALAESPEIEYSLVVGKLNVSGTTIATLEKKGFLEIEKTLQYRNPISFAEQTSGKIELNPIQQRIANRIMDDMDSRHPSVHLIRGVTGSGKTEVYMEAIEHCLSKGRQAIMLIPEISLTYQTLRRFYQRFGDQVSVMHSKLSDGERYDQFQRAKGGEVRVMIGPRSALFTPFPDLGLIIIDEEHETTYKSENSPKYHAAEVAMFMGRMSNAAVILGSATPSLESFYKAQNGEYVLHTMDERVTGRELPRVHIVDLREELKEGNKSIFSRKLQACMEDRLEKGEQMMLFLNRRGYSGFISCRTCGEVIKCPHCDVSLSEHRNGILYCHYCGFSKPVVKNCPVCKSPQIAGFRAGTEQIEEAVHKMFPFATILRMDADTTRNKDDYDEILSRFSNREADILIGTQMIVKGHDFPGVTLMGILAADLSLNSNDYRAGERTFQLLVQAAGRAGRGETPGEVVFQTYQPDHYAITLSATQDYPAFYEAEMCFRELMDYPPAAGLLAIQLTGPDQKRLVRLSEAVVKWVKAVPLEVPVGIIGPAQASLSKKNDIYRYVVYLKHKDRESLIQIQSAVEEQVNKSELKRESVFFDYNPLHMF